MSAENGPTRERRRGSVLGEDTKTEQLDDLVVDFAAFGVDGEFADAVDDFIDRNCAGFAGVDLCEEQNLEWTALHHKFVELVERYLESFCKEKGVSAEAVFEKLSAVNKNENITADFVPQVIRMCEYDFFINNMKEAAETVVNRRLAAEKAEDSRSPDNLSGCYKFAKDLMNESAVNNYYKVTRCPWYFRKILVASLSNLTDVVLHHDDDRKLVFKYSLPVFGRTTKDYFLDDEVREKENMWGKTLKTQCRQEGNKVKITVFSPPYLTNGTNTSTFSMEEIEGAMYLCWNRIVKDDNGSEFAKIVLYFKREEAGVARK